MQFLKKKNYLQNFGGACLISGRSAPSGPRSEGGLRAPPPPPPPSILMERDSPVQLGLIVMLSVCIYVILSFTSKSSYLTISWITARSK